MWQPFLIYIKLVPSLHEDSFKSLSGAFKVNASHSDIRRSLLLLLCSLIVFFFVLNSLLHVVRQSIVFFCSILCLNRGSFRAWSITPGRSRALISTFTSIIFNYFKLYLGTRPGRKGFITLRADCRVTDWAEKTLCPTAFNRRAVANVTLRNFKSLNLFDWVSPNLLAVLRVSLVLLCELHCKNYRWTATVMRMMVMMTLKTAVTRLHVRSLWQDDFQLRSHSWWIGVI